jgi:mono/diheme cytochrome c family protein
MTGSEITLGLVALVLVVFSLVVALLIPRRDPGFPGRNLRVFVLVAALLVVGMLTAVEVLGESHHREGAEAAESAGGESGTAPETGQTGTGQTGTGGGGGAQGDPAAGKEVFTSAGCTTCHTLADAGASGTIGPNLDEVLKGKDAAFIHTSIVDPNAEIAPGFSEGIMPQTYGEELSPEQIADLVAYLQQATQG